MKRIVLQFLAAFLLFTSGASQDASADSVTGAGKPPSGSETARSLYQQSLRWLDSLPDTALFYANQAELILMKDDPGQQLPSLFKLKGRIYKNMNVPSRSLLYYRKAYDEFIKLENQQEIGSCALELGDLYYEWADFSEAYYFYMHSLNAYEQVGERSGIAKMENKLGMVAHEMGKLQEAERHYLNSLEIYRDLGSIPDQCRSLNNIGLILFDRQAFDSALYFFVEAIDLLQSSKEGPDLNLSILSGLYNNMALAYSEKGEFEMALDFLHRGLGLDLQTGDPYDIGSVYNNLGSIFGKLRQQDSALFYLHRSLRIAKEMGFRQLEMEAYEELASLHAGLGSYGPAYNWLLRYDTVYKELFNENQSEQIARLRAHYEQELKDREIEQLHSEAQFQRMLNKVFLGFIIIIVALGVVITVNLRAKNRANKLLADSNLQISEAIKTISESEKELQILNTSKDRIFSIVAHDLRNPVAAVTGFSELLYENFEQFPVETQKEYLLQILQGTQRIQNLLENLLIWARAQMKAIKYEPEELKIRNIVDDCLKELMANLEHKKVNCIVKIDRRCIVFADRTMVRTVFRNLIINAVKFSFPGGKIRITSQLDGETCAITVADEGIGIQPEILEKLFDPNQAVSTPGTTGESGSGLGLVICKEFVEKNKGRIGVESEPGNGSSFTVYLPGAGGLRLSDQIPE